MAIDGFAGVTAIETRAGVIVIGREPPIVPILAATEHCPLALAVSIPPEATVAMLLSEVDQVAVEVMSLVLPSLYEPVALSWRVWPATTLGLVPETWIDCSVGVLFGVCVVPPPPPHPSMVTKITLATKTETSFMLLPREKPYLVFTTARRPPNQERDGLSFQVLTILYTVRYMTGNGRALPI